MRVRLLFTTSFFQSVVLRIKIVFIVFFFNIFFIKLFGNCLRVQTIANIFLLLMKSSTNRLKKKKAIQNVFSFQKYLLFHLWLLPEVSIISVYAPVFWWGGHIKMHAFLPKIKIKKIKEVSQFYLLFFFFFLFSLNLFSFFGDEFINNNEANKKHRANISEDSFWQKPKKVNTKYSERIYGWRPKKKSRGLVTHF